MPYSTHGMSRHPLYRLWKDIKSRCLNPSNRAYQHYGGRGITMAPEWVHDAKAFIGWVEENLGPRPVRMSLDRIDNDGDYEPGNLRWATQADQLRNRRTTNWVGLKGVSRSGENWKAQIHVNRKLIYLGTYNTPQEAAAAYLGARHLLAQCGTLESSDTTTKEN